MQTITRRDAVRLSLGGLTLGGASAAIQSRFGGVMLGAQCYSFRDLSQDAAIQAMVDIGIGACEVNWIHNEPARLRKDRNGLRDWRLTVPLSEFEKVGKNFRAAGIDPWAYTYNIRSDFTDAEMERGFEMTQALGARGISCSGHVSMAKRIDAMARKYKIRVGMHNHSKISPNEVATPADMAEAIKGASDYLGLLFDIGHFVAAGFDPLPFLREHHSRIIAVHVKDRKRDQGAKRPLRPGRHTHQGSVAPDSGQEVRHPRRHRIRVRSEGHGSGSPQVLRIL
jgi:sugar phosphate isomerase/epimerase